jgi:hypothetical protein
MNASKFKRNLFLIPNRINDFDYDSERIENLKKRLPSKYLVLMRISRINNFYKTSILQTFNLYQALRESNIKIVLLLIGDAENGNVSRELNNTFQSSKWSNDIIIINEPFFTHNAKQLLGLADLVVGTGRGFMEAAIKGKMMFVPRKNGQLPALVDKSSFDNVFATNFSERSIVNKTDNEILSETLNILTNEQIRNEYKTFITQAAIDNFLIQNAADKILKSYGSAQRVKLNELFDILIHGVLYIKRLKHFNSSQNIYDS